MTEPISPDRAALLAHAAQIAVTCGASTADLSALAEHAIQVGVHEEQARAAAERMLTAARKVEDRVVERITRPWRTEVELLPVLTDPGAARCARCPHRQDRHVDASQSVDCLDCGCVEGEREANWWMPPLSPRLRAAWGLHR